MEDSTLTLFGCSGRNPERVRRARCIPDQNQNETNHMSSEFKSKPRYSEPHVGTGQQTQAKGSQHLSAPDLCEKVYEYKSSGEN